VTVSDGADNSNVFDLSVTVTALNDAPVAAGDAYEVDEDDTLTVTAPGVLANDTDVEGDTLTAILVSGVSNGSLSLNSDGSFTYTPEAGFDGTDTFSYRANDGEADSDVAVVTITVNPAPGIAISVVDTDVDDTYQYEVGGMLLANVDLAPGNSDPRGATANADGTHIWVVDKDKTVYVYDADGAFEGSWTAGGLKTPEGIATDGTDIWIVDGREKQVFHYDSAAGQTAGSLSYSSSFALNGTNSKPKGITTDGSFIWVVNNNRADAVFKYDVSGTLVGSWTIDGANAKPTGIAIDPAGGSDIWIVDNGADQVFLYTAAAGHASGSQEADTVFDLAGGNTNPQGIAIVGSESSPGPVPNEAPVANDDSDITSQDTPVNVDVLANDTDLENDPLMIDILAMADGTAVVNDNSTPDDYTDDTVDFTPGIGFQGDAWFTYLVNDGRLDSNEATVTIEVTEVNHAPVAGDDNAVTLEDTLVNVDVLDNDSDPDGDPLMIDILASTNGTAVVKDNGTPDDYTDDTVDFTPDPDFYGDAGFTYRVNDGIADSNVATVTIAVNAVNDAPVAVNDEATTDEDVPVVIDVLANDTDVDGDTLTVDSITQGSIGTVVINADDTITYTPNDGITGNDSFTYTMSDNKGKTDTATVTVTVAPVGGVTASNLSFDGKKMHIDLTNSGAAAVTIERLLLNWPSLPNKKLTKIRLNGEIIYAQRTQPPSVLIDSWKGGTDLRTIGAGEIVTLTFEFEKNADTDWSGYGLSIDFGVGLEPIDPTS